MNENKPLEQRSEKVDETRDAKGRFTFGKTGKPKGATNAGKIWFALFEKIETEAQRDEAINSFFKWATKNDRNQAIFYQTFSKMLPTNVDVGLTGDTIIKVISAVPRPSESEPKTEEKK